MSLVERIYELNDPLVPGRTGGDRFAAVSGPRGCGESTLSETASEIGRANGLEVVAVRVSAAGRATRRTAARLPRGGAFPWAVLVPFFLMAALFSVNLSLVAWGRGHHEAPTAGVLIALFSLGSAIGGLIVVGRGRKQNIGRGIGGPVVGPAVLALPLPPFDKHTPLWRLVVAVIVTGTTVAPSLGAGSSRIGEPAPPERRAEAFGRVTTATTGGVALTPPLTGWPLDLEGPAASIGSGAVAALNSAPLTFSLPARAGEMTEAGGAAPAGSAAEVG